MYAQKCREMELKMEEQRNRDAEQTLLKLEELRSFKDDEQNKAVEHAVLNERKLAHEHMEQVSLL